MLDRRANGFESRVEDGNRVSAVDEHSNSVLEELDVLVEGLLMSCVPNSVLSVLQCTNQLTSNRVI